MSNILIKNVHILPMVAKQQVFVGDVAIADDKIVAVGQVQSDFQADTIIDGTDKLVMPGFVNCHTHAAMTLLRSYADDLPLMEWLQEKIWPVEDQLTAEDVYWGTMLAIVEMIRSGTTTFLDMYFFMEQTAKAVEESGIRAVLSRGMIGAAPNGETAFAESRTFVKDYNGKADGRITTMLAPHAPYTCPPEFIKRVMEFANQENVPIHIHLSETSGEVENITKDYGHPPVKLMDELGVFAQKTVAAHCVHLTEEEIDILAAKGVGVAHNPESNMKLASGIAPVAKMLAKGIAVGLGTDGASSNNNLNMLEEMRTAALLQKVGTMSAVALPAYEALKMATCNGARVLGLEKEIGQVAPGFKADLIMFDLEQPHLYPKHDIVANLVYSAAASDIDTVIVNGQVLMQGRKLTTIDEQLVLKKVQEHTEKLIERSKKA